MAQESSKSAPITTELKSHGVILGAFTAFLWVVHLVNAVIFQGHLSALGVAPRTLHGLVGILFAPFLHGSFAHIASNTLPLLVLGWFVMLRRKRDLLYVSVLSALVGGLGTWLIGPSASVHVGASVLIFGYLGYLLARGLFERKFWPIMGSLAVFFLYGGALFGVLPGDVGISWQSHLFGLLGGVGAARMLALPRAKDGKDGKKDTKHARDPEPKRLRVEPAARAPAAPPREALDDDTDEELEALRRRVGRR
jgi:membrane associated rhomboid family serine protease